MAMTEPSVLAQLAVRPLEVLAASAEEEEPESQPTHVVRAVAFSDLEGFTSFTSEKGDVEAGALLKDHYEVVDAIVRRLPGALGSEESLAEESHTQGLLEYPQYTRPSEFRGWQAPDVLLSGHHEEIRRWRRRQSLLRTARRRPDLLAKACLSDDERRWLEEELETKLDDVERG